MRLMAGLVVPIAFLALLELVLRVGGFGHPTAFLLSRIEKAGRMFVQNNQFAWRFFGPQMSRLPAAISIPNPKLTGSIRIFVFGESAAFGDPRPAFGLPRMLEALLSLRYPQSRFEVINAAMTGINSHTILPIARDCAGAQGDIWVIYMGNNEVVGPFGAGTVFGGQVPPLPIIRANLALKTLRLGQLADAVGQHLRPPPPNKTEWGGMLMFVGQHVRAEDPRMHSVYSHFEKNLADILRLGREHDCGMILSTVAVNLKDCAPFASDHRTDLTQDQKGQWNELWQKGAQAQESHDFEAASTLFAEAARLDDSYAELRFRQAQCAVELGRFPEAQAQFIAARDLDALRFRCDTRLNDLIRRAAGDNSAGTLRLADAERAFADQSAHSLPGEDLFYEHVHLTFEGNYLLARTIAAQIEPLLPSTISANGSWWPSIEDCARRLAWNPIESRAAYAEMLVRSADAPFTSQLTHNTQLAHLAKRATPPESGTARAEQEQTLQACEQAAAKFPEDPLLQAELGTLRESANDRSGALRAMRRSLDLLPTSSAAWAGLGLTLVQQHQFQEAADAFRNEFSLDPEDVSALQNLAMCLVKQNRLAGAIREYRHALRIKPRFGPAWLGLGLALEGSGDKQQAQECFQKALSNRIHRGQDLATLARFCASRGWYEAATTNYSEALKLSGPDPNLNYEAGQVFGMTGRHREAAQCFAAAAELSPNWPQAQFQCGRELGQSGQPAAAEARFKEAIRLMPDLLEARLNLGISLLNQNRDAEALEELEQLLQRSPTNALALRYVHTLRQKLSRN
jgi:tetratricopeptide (TPR) repeat protein